MTLTVVISEKPYTNDNAWNALRLAQTALAAGNQVNVFLLGDAVYATRKDQSPGPDRANLEDMVVGLVAGGADIRVCTTCIHARPYEPSGEYSSCFVGSASGEKLSPGNLISGVKMGTMADLLDWTLNTKTISF